MSFVSTVGPVVKFQPLQSVQTTHARLLAWKCVFSTQQCQLVGVMCIKFVNGEISLNGYHLTPSVAIWVQL